MERRPAARVPPLPPAGATEERAYPQIVTAPTMSYSDEYRCPLEIFFDTLKHCFPVVFIDFHQNLVFML